MGSEHGPGALGLVISMAGRDPAGWVCLRRVSELVGGVGRARSRRCRFLLGVLGSLCWAGPGIGFWMRRGGAAAGN